MWDAQLISQWWLRMPAMPLLLFLQSRTGSHIAGGIKWHGCHGRFKDQQNIANALCTCRGWLNTWQFALWRNFAWRFFQCNFGNLGGGAISFLFYFFRSWIQSFILKDFEWLVIIIYSKQWTIQTWGEWNTSKVWMEQNLAMKVWRWNEWMNLSHLIIFSPQRSNSFCSIIFLCVI